MSSAGSLSDDSKNICVSYQCGKAAHDFLAGAFDRSHAALDPIVPGTSCLADIAVRRYHLWHALHVLCRISDRLSIYPRLESGCRRTSLCRRCHWCLSCDAGGWHRQQTLRASVRGDRGKRRHSRTRSQAGYSHGRLFRGSNRIVLVCVDDVSISALDCPRHRCRLLLVWPCHGLHLADELSGRLM